jgi:hypothetical protein
MPDHFKNEDELILVRIRTCSYYHIHDEKKEEKEKGSLGYSGI